MSLLPTPNSMPFIASGNILPLTGLYQHRYQQQQPHHQQQQLTNQPYLLVNPDRSLYPNYYLVYVPLIGSPSTSTPNNMVASSMSTSVLQASTLLNSLLTATSLLNTPTKSNAFALRKLNTIPTTSSSSIAYIRQQYRYNMRPSYRYVPN